ncbi:MAG: hypothetical protein CVU88_04505 [Firmicutes bacterium HGW-Firmicutes-13]|nr:MAG: hypothetical protein CVU88_04505 [Firmicutes bacterium HGW-Firmicutes-13]
MSVPDVLAFPLEKAREILHNRGYKIAEVISLGPGDSGGDVLRVARQKLNKENLVEIVAVYSKDKT